MKFVSIIMGSKSDYDVVSEAAKVLEKFNVPYELIISSAHRSPKRTSEYVAAAEEKGAQVFIAAAGMAAHLACALFDRADARRHACGHRGYRQGRRGKRSLSGATNFGPKRP